MKQRRLRFSYQMQASDSPSVENLFSTWNSCWSLLTCRTLVPVGIDMIKTAVSDDQMENLMLLHYPGDGLWRLPGYTAERLACKWGRKVRERVIIGLWFFFFLKAAGCCHSCLPSFMSSTFVYTSMRQKCKPQLWACCGCSFISAGEQSRTTSNARVIVADHLNHLGLGQVPLNLNLPVDRNECLKNSDSSRKRVVIKVLIKLWLWRHLYSY